jgi:hypothetical protein
LRTKFQRIAATLLEYTAVHRREKKPVRSRNTKENKTDCSKSNIPRTNATAINKLQEDMMPPTQTLLPSAMVLLMLVALHVQVLPCDAIEDKWSSTDTFLDLIDAKADPSTAEPERGEDALDSLLQSIPGERPEPVSATAGLTGAVSEFSCELLLAAESGPPGTEMRLLLPVSSGLFYTLPCLNGSPFLFLPAGTGRDRPSSALFAGSLCRRRRSGPGITI